MTTTYPKAPEMIQAYDFLTDADRGSQPGEWNRRFEALQEALERHAGEEALFRFETRRRPDKRGWDLFGYAESQTIDWEGVEEIIPGTVFQLSDDELVVTGIPREPAG